MGMQCLRIVIALLMLPALAPAELYRYTDERGVIHFTDNYIEIPEVQRSKVEIIKIPEESAPLSVKTETSGSETLQDAEAGFEGEQPTEAADAQTLQGAPEPLPPPQEFEALVKSKTDLDKIYDALAAEKAVLEKEQTTLKTIEGIRDFQDKVNQFNQRLADYERQRQAFQVRADAYNKAISQ